MVSEATTLSAGVPISKAIRQRVAAFEPIEVPRTYDETPEQARERHERATKVKLESDGGKLGS